MSKKSIVLVVAILSLSLLVAGGTYAYWKWSSNTNKNVVFNTASGIQQYVVYDEGYSSFVGNFQPTATFCEGIHTTISFYKTNEITNTPLEATINMNVNSIGANTKASNDVYWVITSGDGTSCTGNLSSALAHGTFNGRNNGDVITLLPNIEVSTSIKKYTVWIWIDQGGSNLSLLSGEKIDTNIWTQIDMVGDTE